jgi:hypothetical protein
MKIEPWQYAVGAGAFFVAYRFALAPALASENPSNEYAPPPPPPPVNPFVGDTSEEQRLATLRSQVVNTAFAEADRPVIEYPPKNSRNHPRIAEYNASVGLTNPRSLWCAAFIGWCVREGLNLPNKPRWATGSVSANYFNVKKALKNGLLSPDSVAFVGDPNLRQKVKAGWVWSKGTFNNGNPDVRWLTGHTELVVNPNYSNTEFLTVGGNTNQSGMPLLGVYRKRHSWSNPAENTVYFFDPVAMSMIYDNPTVS